MEGEEGERERGFKVQDRRRFSATGDAHEPGSEVPTPPPPVAPGSPQDAPSEPALSSDANHLHAEITFAAFIISLSAQALALLGEIPDPVDHTTHVDLEAARQIIDILGLLREKTRGNLDAAETSLLDSALYDLRMQYVDRAQGR